jgi:signal transduction histidine kinase
LVVERERLLHEQTEAQARELALIEATRRMDEFLGTASHELRTPLTNITANVQLAGRQLRGLGQHATQLDVQESGGHENLRCRMERSALILERTEWQAARRDRLVGDLLDVSRIQSGKLELRQSNARQSDHAHVVVVEFTICLKLGKRLLRETRAESLIR